MNCDWVLRLEHGLVIDPWAGLYWDCEAAVSSCPPGGDKCAAAAPAAAEITGPVLQVVMRSRSWVTLLYLFIFSQAVQV